MHGVEGQQALFASQGLGTAANERREADQLPASSVSRHSRDGRR